MMDMDREELEAHHPHRVVEMLGDFIQHAEGMTEAVGLQHHNDNVGEERMPPTQLGAPHTRGVRCLYRQGHLEPRTESWEQPEMQAHCEGEEYAQLVERWMGVGEQVLTTEGEEVGIDGDCVLKLFQRWGHMEDGGVWHWQRSTQEIIKLQLEKKELDSMSPTTTTTREREAPSQPPKAGATSARAEKGERRKHKAPPQPTTTPTDQAKGKAISEAVAYH